MLIKKDCYVHFIGENTIKANTDLIVVDQYAERDNLVMISLLDAPAKIDKIQADYRKNALGVSAYLNERFTNENVLRDAKCESFELDFMNSDLKLEKKKVGKFSHMIMSRNREKSDYIFNFNNENVNELILKKLVNDYFIPCKTNLIQDVLIEKPDVIKKMLVITKNTKLEHIEVYRINLTKFKEVLQLVAERRGESANKELVKLAGNFTNYINEFRPQIVDNLFTRLDFFYDKDNVPDYVTTFPRPLPNEQMKAILQQISQKLFNKPFTVSGLSYEEWEKVHNTFHALDKAGRIPRREGYNPRYSKQYEVWASGMKILEKEKFLYLSLTMGAGKTLSSLKINKYTCETTLKAENHITFILAPQSTLTQWLGEIELIEKGKGRTKKDYDVLIVSSVDDLIKFHKKHSKTVNKYNKNGKLISGSVVFDKNSITRPTYILTGKEVFKLSQTSRPAFIPTIVGVDERGNDVHELKCPNCGGLLVEEKTDKNNRKFDVNMDFSSFYKKVKDSFKKNPKPSKNYECKNCKRLMDEKRDYKILELEAKEEAKEQSSKYVKFYIENPEDNQKKIAPANNKLWTRDYVNDNYIRNKMFYKLEAVTELKNRYTVLNDAEEFKKKFSERKEKMAKLREDYGLVNLIPDETTYEQRQCGYKPKMNLRVKKVSIPEFLKKRMIDIDTTIIDEAHEGSNVESLIGAAQKLLFKFSKRIILLSGTANNGYSSSLHGLLSAAMPGRLLEDSTFHKADFVAKYGIRQAKRKLDETGKISGKIELQKSAFSEAEGINPVAFTKFLARNFIMVNSLTHLDLPLPELKEYYLPIELDNQIRGGYLSFVDAVKKVNPIAAKTLRDKVFKNYINNPYSWDNYKIGVKEDGVKSIEEIEVKNVDRDSLPYTNKDYELIDIIRKEVEENRKCFLFTDFVNGGSYIMEEEWEGSKKPKKVTINDRICKMLDAEKIKYVVMKSDDVGPVQRKKWIDDHKDDYDVFICQPQLVNVGLNLVFCPTYIVYTPQYRYDIISQATRRGYRANSVEENRVYHLYFKNCCEEEIINRYQRKLAEAKAIEGDFNVNLEENKNIRTLSKMSAKIVAGS